MKLIQGNRLHPTSMKLGNIFLVLILTTIAVMKLISGDISEGIILLLLSTFLAGIIIYIFSEKSHVLPYIDVMENEIELKKNILSKRKLFTLNDIKQIKFGEDGFAISTWEKDYYFSEMNRDVLRKIREEMILTSFRKFLI